MEHINIPSIRTTRWGTELTHYTTPREKAMQSRFPVDYPCLMCNRRLVKPNTVCFSCTHLLSRVLAKLTQARELRYTTDVEVRYYRATDKYIEQQQGKAILAGILAVEKEQRKEEFMQRINNPRDKQHELTHIHCKFCGMSLPYSSSRSQQTYCEHCDRHNFSFVVLI